ncbi:MAG TPA: hypothetical protein VM940_17145 [Chthoniobacterales bacterium]|jgi:vacuolar-type H+-ATPase subunit E/Vma4|nr:hypothetical protein [Chthoniobacterales bacterium]
MALILFRFRYRRDVNKKDHQRLVREHAERDAEARVESKDRQEKIKVRWNLREGQSKGRKNRAQAVREAKVKRIRELFERVQDLTSGDDREELEELVELVALQDREIEYLSGFRSAWERVKTHYPAQLKNMSAMALFAELRPHMEAMRVKRKPKQTYESKRSQYKLGESGEIENGFGNTSPCGVEAFDFALPIYQGRLAMCPCPVIDDILAGGAVSMAKLQRLFGLNRNRFPKRPPSFKKGRERLYDYRAVTKIMNSLLSEQTGSSGGNRQGRPRRGWPCDPAKRTLILAGIVARLKDTGAPKHIADAFTRVIRKHAPDSAKK